MGNAGRMQGSGDCEMSEKGKKNPQPNRTTIVDKAVDNVDNYAPKSASPTDTMSPAPIVINRSPLVRFCSKNASISSKDLK